MIATKDQERQALEKIKKIVARLGEGSYIGTAFEGCFEIAEQNIDNDSAFSYKEMAVSAQANLVKSELENTKMRDLIKSLRKDRTSLEIELLNVRNSQITEGLYKALHQSLEESIAMYEGRMKSLAETIVHYADTPGEIAFKRSVDEYRKIQIRKTAAENTIKTLEEYEPKGC